MSLRRYLQLDVFAGHPGAGNPLGVVLDAEDGNGKPLDDEAMQAFAAWTNLSETIFLLPAADPDADYRVRIFTPRRELPFAGHPSVGAAWAALETGLARADGDTLVQECGAGLLPVRVETGTAGHTIHVRAPRARQLPEVAAHASLLQAVLDGMPCGSQPASFWDNGPHWWLVELEDAAAVRALQPDLPAIAALSRASGAVGLAVHGRSQAADHQLAVRAFCPADNIPEDPVTGSANAAIAACLAQAGALPGQEAAGCKGDYIASQGRELGRDGRVMVRVDDAGDVWIGGQVQPVIEGHVHWLDTVPETATDKEIDR